MRYYLDARVDALADTLSLSCLSPVFHVEPRPHPVSVKHSRCDTTLFVGDNLPNLKWLAATESSIFDFCYIDPPYNTGSTFLYNDKRSAPATGPFGSNSAWMMFMLPRLVAAQALLKESGIIAISIDDHAFAHLKILMDRVFDESNHLGTIAVCRSKNGKGGKANIATSHEYLLLYGKSPNASLRGQADDGVYEKEDAYGHYRIDGLFRKKGDASLRSDRPNMYYPLYYHPSSGRVSVEPTEGWMKVLPIDSKGVQRRWVWSKETAKTRAYQLYASKTGVIYIKNYAGNSSEQKRIKPRTFWDKSAYYTQAATNELTHLFGGKVFDTPKPLQFIADVIDMCAPPNAMVLDFFAGSGTTAHAIALLNQAEGVHRRCVLMESSAQIPEKHRAYELGYRQIHQITRMRLSILDKIYPGFSYQMLT